MVQLPGSAPAHRGVPPPPSPGWLQAQLARAEQQLNACLACETADTSQGQAQIGALSRRIQALKAQLEGASGSQRTPAAQANEAAPPTDLDPGTGTRLDLTV